MPFRRYCCAWNPNAVYQIASTVQASFTSVRATPSRLRSTFVYFLPFALFVSPGGGNTAVQHLLGERQQCLRRRRQAGLPGPSPLVPPR